MSSCIREQNQRAAFMHSCQRSLNMVLHLVHLSIQCLFYCLTSSALIKKEIICYTNVYFRFSIVTCMAQLFTAGRQLDINNQCQKMHLNIYERLQKYGQYTNSKSKRSFKRPTTRVHLPSPQMRFSMVRLMQDILEYLSMENRYRPSGSLAMPASSWSSLLRPTLTANRYVPSPCSFCAISWVNLYVVIEYINMLLYWLEQNRTEQVRYVNMHIAIAIEDINMLL